MPRRWRRYLDFELGLSIALSAGCLYFLLLGFDAQIPKGGGDGLEGLLPTAVTIVALILVGSMGLSRLGTLAVADEPEETELERTARRAQFRRSAAFLAGSIAYAVILPWLGYVVSSIGLIALFLFLMHERHPLTYVFIAMLPPFLLNLLLARVLYVRFTPLDNFLAGVL